MKIGQDKPEHAGPSSAAPNEKRALGEAEQELNEMRKSHAKMRKTKKQKGKSTE